MMVLEIKPETLIKLNKTAIRLNVTVKNLLIDLIESYADTTSRKIPPAP